MELLADLLMPSLWAFLACVGFGLVSNIQGAGILICGFGGALGWFFYLIARQWVGSIVAAFLAAVAITVFSEWMARVRRCPVTGYLQVALLPLCGGRYPAISVHAAEHLWHGGVPGHRGDAHLYSTAPSAPLFSRESEKQRMTGGAAGENGQMIA